MKIWKLLLAMAFSASAFCGCGGGDGELDVDRCLDFLYDNMPVDDEFAYDHTFWEENVAKTLEIRDRMGWDVPEREFLHFVLPVRVGDEPLDRFRLEYADSICAAVEGMNMSDAVLEINYWCLSHVNYRSDAPGNLSPLGVMAYKGSQCDGLTVFTVNAMRAAGIPARKVICCWSHADLGHGWTEVWVDGKWLFCGSAEPHVYPGIGWFNDRASQCFQTEVAVFGRYDGPEPVVSRSDGCTTINSLALYTRNLRDASVRVVDLKGAPVQGATVDFRYYNSGSLMSIGQCVTGPDGVATVRGTGCGSLVAFAFKDGMAGIGIDDGSRPSIELRGLPDESVHVATAELSIPPADDNIPPYTDEQFLQVLARDAVCDSIRNSLPDFQNPDSVARAAVLRASRPYIPHVRLPASSGEISVVPVTDGSLQYGHDFSLLRLDAGKLEPVRSLKVAPGRYILVTGRRCGESNVIVSLDMFVIPEGIDVARLPVSIPSETHSR